MKIYVISLFCLIFLSCQQSNEDCVRKSLLEMNDRFPQLSLSMASDPSAYSVQKTLVLDDIDVELRFCAVNDSTEKGQQAIVITNSQKQRYAIPFLSNDYCNYWDFECDSLGDAFLNFDTTFEKEFLIALNVLELTNMRTAAGPILDGVFMSLLRCRVVMDCDSLYIKDDRGLKCLKYCPMRI